MKACQRCDRVIIGREHVMVSPIRVFLGLPFVYGPAVFLPVILLPAFLVYIHLRMMGAQNLRTLGSFLPDKKSHRYEYKSQIVRMASPRIAFWTRTRVFWVLNCTWYCPFSVATLEWFTYLVKIVETWWCPFAHDRKAHYAVAAIDSSYWHDPANIEQLHPEDRDNPIWNEGSDAVLPIEVAPGLEGKRAMPRTVEPQSEDRPSQPGDAAPSGERRPKSPLPRA